MDQTAATEIREVDFSLCECSAYSLHNGEIIHLSWCEMRRRVRRETGCCEMNCASPETHKVVWGD